MSAIRRPALGRQGQGNGANSYSLPAKDRQVRGLFLHFFDGLGHIWDGTSIKYLVLQIISIYYEKLFRGLEWDIATL